MFVTRAERHSTGREHCVYDLNLPQSDHVTVFTPDHVTDNSHGPPVTTRRHDLFVIVIIGSA